MIALRTASPNPVLEEFVRVYAQREVHPFESGSEILVEPIPARLEQIIEFQFGQPFNVLRCEGFSLRTPASAIIGAQVKGCARIELRPGIESFGVFFRPAGFSRLLGLPIHVLSHQAYDGALISKLIPELWDRLAECKTFERRVCVIEGVLLKLAARAPRKEKMVAVAEHVFSARGAVRVSELASHAGLGLRQFERRFLEVMGVTPKRYARVARFQNALDAKIFSPHRSWLEIAHDLEYHDQMHMIRDFELLGGDTPTHLFAQIGDARPSAMSSAEPKPK
jgi:AraC-like DNA-binding protein